MPASPFRYFKTSPEIIHLAVMLYVRRARHLGAWPQWRWHLDEAFVRINGKIHYLWRAVDHEGEVLEAYVTKRRDRKAALKFLRKAMKRYGQPNAIVTDKLGSYRPALRTIGAPGNRPLAQQPGGKLPPAAQTPRTGNAAVPADGNASEIRSRPFIRAQSFQPAAPSLQPRKFQAEPRRRSRPVARAQCCIIVRRTSANIGALHILTMP
jgi:transposase-like protein